MDSGVNASRPAALPCVGQGKDGEGESIVRPIFLLQTAEKQGVARGILKMMPLPHAEEGRRRARLTRRSSLRRGAIWYGACEGWPVPRSPSSPRGVRAAPSERTLNKGACFSP